MAKIARRRVLEARVPADGGVGVRTMMISVSLVCRESLVLGCWCPPLPFALCLRLVSSSSAGITPSISPICGGSLMTMAS